jgi:cellulose synthase/poly-beta-1,6-N-acetylglucosamine synthase-like glycosyltransferase
MFTAKIIFWASLFIIIYTYFGYIALSFVLGKLFGKKVKKQEIYPAISIIVACYNEESIIRQKLENLLSLEYPSDKLQIMIASESIDNTNGIVSEYRDRGIELYAFEGRHGKTTLLYNVVPKARNEILVFSDANTIFEKDVLKKIAANFAEERIGAVTGLLQISNPKASSISWGEYMYKKYETALRKSNSALRRVLNPDGSIFAIRKELYNPISPERGDDFELVIRTLINGYDSVFEPEAISHEEASISTKAETARKIRMISWFLKSTAILLKEMLLKLRFDLIFQIVSHKIFRWFTPFFFLIFFISNIFVWKDGLFYKLFLIAQIAGYLMGILGLYISGRQKKKPPLLLGAMQYFLMYNYAFMIGILAGLIPDKASHKWEKVRP